MEYKVEIVKYRTETVSVILTVDEMDEDYLESVLDDLEDYKYSPSDVATQLVQRLPNVKGVRFGADEHYTGLECTYDKRDGTTAK